MVKFEIVSVRKNGHGLILRTEDDIEVADLLAPHFSHKYPTREIRILAVGDDGSKAVQRAISPILKPKQFIDECDEIIDKAATAMKATIRRYVSAGGVENVDDVESLVEVKAAVCAALTEERDQWRFRGEESVLERQFGTL